jgi:hypothetical protein
MAWRIDEMMSSAEFSRSAFGRDGRFALGGSGVFFLAATATVPVLVRRMRDDKIIVM